MVQALISLLKANQYGSVSINTDYDRLLRTVRPHNSVVGTEILYWLDGPGIETRWGGNNFHALQNGTEAHPPTSARDTGPFSRSFARVDPDHPTSSTAEFQNVWCYNSTYPLFLQWHVWLTFTFTTVFV